MRHFVVGDVHGAGAELERLVNELGLRTDDKLILVGDVFDRGDHAPVVWRLIREYRADVFLGNHERKMLQFLSGQRAWLPLHYYHALNLLLDSGVSLDELMMFLESLPLVKQYRTGDGVHRRSFVVAHAGVRLDDIAAKDLSANVYGRSLGQPKAALDWWDRYDGDELVLYGHVVCPGGSPRVRSNSHGVPNSIGLDTAVVHGGPLTCYCPETDQVHQVRSGIDYYAQLQDRFRREPPTIHPSILEFRNSQRPGGGDSIR